MDIRKLNSRLYSWEVISYTDLSVWKSVLENYSNAVNYLYILHNRDFVIDSDGNKSLAKPHIHTYITLRREVSRKKLSKDLNYILSLLNVPDFTILPENIVYIEGSLSDCLDYAIHKFEPDKAQYDISECFSTDIRRFKRSFASVDNKGFSVLQDLESGLSLREMAMKYGRDFIIHYEQYKYFFEEMQFQDKISRSLSEK